jgi:hypothetical protein
MVEKMGQNSANMLEAGKIDIKYFKFEANIFNGFLDDKVKYFQTKKGK